MKIYYSDILIFPQCNLQQLMSCLTISSVVAIYTVCYIQYNVLYSTVDTVLYTVLHTVLYSIVYSTTYSTAYKLLSKDRSFIVKVQTNLHSGSDFIISPDASKQSPREREEDKLHYYVLQ